MEGEREGWEDQAWITCSEMFTSILPGEGGGRPVYHPGGLRSADGGRDERKYFKE